MLKHKGLLSIAIFFLFAFSTFAYAVNYGQGNYGAGLYSATVVDTTAPVISAVSSGTPNQTTATITWTTNEPADSQVQYGATTSYGSTTTLDTTMVTSHSVPISGLTANTTYHYAVVSKDPSNNSSTSSDGTFTTAITPDTTPPVRSNGAPTSLPSGTTQATLSLSTDEAATCKYGTTASTAYASIANTFTTTGGTTHSATVTGLTNGSSYTYYVRCIDGATNADTTDFAITFTVAADTTPPVLSAGAPTGTLASGTTSANITLTTDEAATCKYSQSSGVAYGSMTNTFTTTGSTSHSTSVTGLTNGTAYNTYVRCSDVSNNANTSDYLITFTVDIAPSGGGGGGGGGGGSSSSGSTSGGTTVTTTTTPATTSTGVLCTLGQTFSPTTGQRCTAFLTSTIPADCTTLTAFSASTGQACPNYGGTAVMGTGTGYTILTLHLMLRDRNDEVKMLQHYLNTHGYTVAASGPGSLGQETTYFGPATKTAVIKFQKAHGLTPDGMVGTMTRTMIAKNS